MTFQRFFRPIAGCCWYQGADVIKIKHLAMEGKSPNGKRSMNRNKEAAVDLQKDEGKRLHAS